MIPSNLRCLVHRKHVNASNVIQNKDITKSLTRQLVQSYVNMYAQICLTQVIRMFLKTHNKARYPSIEMEKILRGSLGALFEKYNLHSIKVRKFPVELENKCFEVHWVHFSEKINLDVH